MPLYLPVNQNGKVSIAICPRCCMKMQYSDLKQDPNDMNWYCAACVDLYDPWRLPARVTEDITLTHPRPDTELE